MTFKGAFQSFQTVLVLCADTAGRSWVRARPASPAAPAPPPQCCGVQHLAAQVLPTTVDPLPVVIGSISSQPSPGKLWIFLFCWAAPSRGRSFLVAMARQPGAGFLLGLCVQKAASAPLVFFHSEERPGRGEPEGVVAGESQGAELLGTPRPSSGGPQHFQLLRVPSGPPLALGTCGTLGMLPLPSLLLLIAGRGDSQHWELFSGC